MLWFVVPMPVHVVIEKCLEFCLFLRTNYNTMPMNGILKIPKKKNTCFHNGAEGAIFYLPFLQPLKELLAKFTAHDLHMGWNLKAVCRCLLCDNNAVLCHKHHACWLVCHSAVMCHNACMLFVVCQNKSFLGAFPPASWVPEGNQSELVLAQIKCKPSLQFSPSQLGLALPF